MNYRATRDLTSTIIRLKPGVTIEQARAEVAAVARRLAARFPGTNRGVDATVLPVWAGHLGLQGLLLKPLRILMAVCALLLLIVCANVANLLLARAVSRQKEFGIRLALGARRGRLARQLLTETLILAGAGALVGVILVMWIGPALLFLAPRIDVPLDLGGGVNLPTLAFTVLIAAVATVISGMAPVLFSVRADLNEALKEGGRSGGSGTRSHRLRGMLVMAQVALAMVALVGAGLFYRSFRNTVGIRPGFDMNNVSVSQFYLSYAGYSAQQQWDFCRKLRERLEAEPGVLGVTYSDVVPLGSPVGSAPWHQLEIEGYVPAPNEQMLIHRATIPPGYFQFMRIPLLEGREFTDRDDEHASEVRIIVNETFARHFFRGRDPIGRKLKLERDLAIVVGLVKDSKYHSLAESAAAVLLLAVPAVVPAGAELLRVSADGGRSDADDSGAAARSAGAQPGRGIQHQAAGGSGDGLAVSANGGGHADERGGADLRAAGGHRAVLGDELRGEPTDAGVGNTRGLGRAAERCARTGGTGGPEAIASGPGCGSGRGSFGCAGGKRHVDPGEPDGPGDARRGGIAAGAGRGGRQLRPGAARHAD